MKAKILLRIAAVLILVHLLGHSVGHSTWNEPEDAKMQDVVTSMYSHKAEFMGAVKSMADYYNGYSLMIFFLFGMSICILWIVSGFIHLQRKIAISILLPVAFSYIAFGLIEFIHFFPFAGALSSIVGLLVLIAIAVSKRNS